MQREEVFKNLGRLPGLEGFQTLLAELETLCRDRQQMREQERLHLWLHLWWLAHVPLAVALLALGTVHAVLVLYY
jgi:hypothetical protein